MKNLKKLAVAGAAILAVSATSVTALAASGYTSPAEIVAGLTGSPVETVIAEKTESGSTYGAIAGASGVLAEFRAEMLALRKADLSERVAAGTMTQEKADAIIAAMEANQADCDGTGSGAGIGAGMGARFGGYGNGTGTGSGGANRNSHGGGRYGSGSGLGTCTVQAE